MNSAFKKLLTVVLFINLILSLWGPGAFPDNTNPGGGNEPSYQLLSDLPDKDLTYD